MELTKNQIELVAKLKAKGFDKDNVIGFILTLKTEENYAEMLDWLSKNDNARMKDIFNKLHDIMGIDVPRYDDEE